jgi:hypothetical protein
MTKLSNSQYSLCEAVSDISMSMGYYGFRFPDSRVSVSKSIEWAEEFEQKNKGREWDGEYLDEIDAFAVKKMREFVATGEAEVEKPLPE